MTSKDQNIFIIGAGPAGLTAAFELASAGYHRITIVEATDYIGGLSRTAQHHGNRIDIGGHRFFSKSEWVMNWWLQFIPLAGAGEPHSLRPEDGHAFLKYQGQSLNLPLADKANAEGDSVMLVRDRLSRILFGGKFFDYPLKLNFDTAWKLGPFRCLAFGASYVWSQLFPRRPENTLEDFFINRFGHKLYRQFFKDYTEKVWGRSCDQISADWGAQRVKSLSIAKALLHAIRQVFASDASKRAEQTSLIEHFLYPKLGPGQMWETVADRVRSMGVEIRMQTRVGGMHCAESGITTLETIDVSGRTQTETPDVVISTMPIRELVTGMTGVVPERVRGIASALEYRDFMTVGLLYKNMSKQSDRQIVGRASIPDNWIYIQEPGVHVGRLQIFNNWSPYLVNDTDQTWVGLEFFCAEGDHLWTRDDASLIDLSKHEMEQIGLAQPTDCVDGVVIRMAKAYPGYYGAYENFEEVRSFLDGIPNLFLIGRNGMHRYNNQDHSMLSAKAAVSAIMSGSQDKSAIWAINVDDDYHEEK